MTKLRKQRRKKTYKASVNRKRLRKRLYNVGKIQCDELKQAWEQGRSVKRNFKDMGLVFDPNENIKSSNIKQKLRSQIQATSKWKEEPVVDERLPTKTYVAEELEKEAKAPRVRMFRLPKGQVEWITYLMDKYGDNYRAMTLDRRNYNQETWKQLRAKINVFKGIPEQYEEYLKRKESDVKCE